MEWRYGSKLLYLHLNEHLALILRYVPSFYSTVYKATDIDEVVADLYMDSPENLSIVSDPGSLSETVALPNNQVNDRQKVRPERERKKRERLNYSQRHTLALALELSVLKIYTFISACFTKAAGSDLGY